MPPAPDLPSRPSSIQSSNSRAECKYKFIPSRVNAMGGWWVDGEAGAARRVHDGPRGDDRRRRRRDISLGFCRRLQKFFLSLLFFFTLSSTAAAAAAATSIFNGRLFCLLRWRRRRARRFLNWPVNHVYSSFYSYIYI